MAHRTRPFCHPLRSRQPKPLQRLDRILPTAASNAIANTQRVLAQPVPLRRSEFEVFESQLGVVTLRMIRAVAVAAVLIVKGALVMVS